MRTQIVNGVKIALTTEEESEVDAREVEWVNTYREKRREQFRGAASERISALFGGKVGDKLIQAQQNLQGRASQLHRRETRGTATPEELAELEGMDALFDQIVAIRVAENTASGMLDAAGTDQSITIDERVAGIEAVAAIWP